MQNRQLFFITDNDISKNSVLQYALTDVYRLYEYFWDSTLKPSVHHLSFLTTSPNDPKITIKTSIKGRPNLIRFNF